MSNKRHQLTPTMFLEGERLTFSTSEIDEIRDAALSAPLKRARACLHQTSGDHVQEMIAVFCHDTYVCPHRHVQHSETLVMLEGEMDVVFFDDEGDIVDCVALAANKPDTPFLVRLSDSAYHSVVVRSDMAVMHEIAKGPYTPQRTQYAPWAVAESLENDLAAALQSLQTDIARWREAHGRAR